MTVRTHPTGRFGLSALGLPALARRLGLAAASRIRVGQLTVVLPDGSRRTFGDAESELRAEIHVHDEAAAVRILLHGETGAGEAYMDGLWSSPDLVGLLDLAARNRSALALTESVTRIADRSDPVPDDVWDEAARHWTEKQLAALVLQIALINSFNRVNAAVRQVAGAKW